MKTMQALIKKLQIEIKEKDLRIQRLQNVIKEYTELTFEKDAEIQRLRDVIQNPSGKLKIKKENIENQVNSEKKKKSVHLFFALFSRYFCKKEQNTFSVFFHFFRKNSWKDAQKNHFMFSNLRKCTNNSFLCSFSHK